MSRAERWGSRQWTHALADVTVLRPMAREDALADVTVLRPMAREDALADRPMAPVARHHECDNQWGRRRLLRQEQEQVSKLQTATEERCLEGSVDPLARWALAQRRKE